MLWIILCVIFTALFYYILKTSFYWKNRGVDVCSPLELWKGGLAFLVPLKSNCDVLVDIQNRHPDDRYIGINLFFRNILLIKDPNLIKQILNKEFETFSDHYPFINFENDLWGKNLLLLQGQRWKEMRVTLSPTFTGSKIRGMFKLFQECTDQFLKYLQDRGSGKIDIDIKDALVRFTSDVIGSAAFGVACNSLKEPENKFYLMGKDATDLSGIRKTIRFLLIGLAPKLANILGVRFTSEQVTSFFRNLVKTTIDTREKNGIVRPDMIHLLMEARKGNLKYDNDDVVDSSFAVLEESDIGKQVKNRKTELSDDDLTAQVLLFFFAGFESVSNAMCFTLYELAVDCDIQQRLQKEIDDTLEQSDGIVTYDTVLKMKYLDMVISETLRKWPSIALTDRTASKPYTIEPTRKVEKPIHLYKGEVVGIPIYSMHRDPQFYPNPDRFDPERFNDENKSKIVPGSYIPFGLGPRSCIGTRFALVEIKLLIVKFLAKFNVTIISKTQVPIKIKVTQFLVSPKKGLWLGLEPRSS